MKLDALVDNIAIKLDKNSDWVFKQVLRDDIISQRAFIIKQDYERTRVIPTSIYQTIRCVKAIQVRDLDCVSCQGGTVWRTEKKVPKPILVNSGFDLFTITNPLKSSRSSIGVLSVEEVEFIKHRRFTSDVVFATWENEYFYFHNVAGLHSVSVRGVFENPFKVLELYSDDYCCVGCDSVISNCFDEGELELEESYVDRIKTFVYKENERVKHLDIQIDDNKPA